MVLTELGQQLIDNTNAAMANGDAGVAAAQSGLNAVLGGKSTVTNAVNNMNANANQMNVIGGNMLGTAQTAKETYDKLTPVANTFGNYGASLWGEGSDLTGRANSLFGIGDSLLTMDPNATGLAGEYLKMYNYLSPDRYVSSAASDVQGAFSNAQGQAERQLARKGVSAGSGASLALQKQYAQSLATALAAAKTKARQTGITEQSNYLDKMLGAANTLYGTANATEQNALSAKSQSLAATKNQADTIATQGQGYAAVGGLQGDAASVFGNAASVMGNAATINTNYLNTLNTAYGNLAKANEAAGQLRNQAENVKQSAFNNSPTITVSTDGKFAYNGRRVW